MPIYYPPLPGTSNDADTLVASQTFAPRRDVMELRNAGLKSVLGFSSAAGSTPDDASAIIATQVFGP